MTKTSPVTDERLNELRDQVNKNNAGKQVRAWQIEALLKNENIELDASTIRGRFIQMKTPLSGILKEKPAETPIVTPQKPVEQSKAQYPSELEPYIPKEDDFNNYVERPVDKRLATHYKAGKYPLTQGKQGTGKTFSHNYYAHKSKMPFFLFSCHEDFKLPKLFGDKTIKDGSVKFQESIFTKAIQHPTVILFDEINAVSNANTFDFHALLQNRELFIKDANDGEGKTYKLHPECKIGFAQNPKSAKYIGGTIKPSNFLGRCTYITYPEFTQAEITQAISKRYPKMPRPEIDKFTKFYFACCETIDKGNIPVDISIRQLNNVIDLYTSGLTLSEAVEDGMTSILEAISQPKAKEAFSILAQATWKEVFNQPKKFAFAICLIGGY